MDELDSALIDAKKDAEDGVPGALERVLETQTALLDMLHDQRRSVAVEISQVAKDCNRLNVIAEKAAANANNAMNRKTHLQKTQRLLEARIQDLEEDAVKRPRIQEDEGDK